MSEHAIGDDTEHRHHRKDDEVEADSRGLVIPWVAIGKAIMFIATGVGAALWGTATYEKTSETAANTGVIAAAADGQALADLDARMRRAETRIAPLDPAWRGDVERQIVALTGGQSDIMKALDKVLDAQASMVYDIKALRRESKARDDADAARDATESNRGGRNR